MQVITKSSFMIFLILLLLLLLLLAAHSSTDVIARSGCDDHCGNLSIPFPFGIGSKCSLEPSFNISCDTWSVPPKAYLSILGNNEVVEIRQDYVRVKYPNLASVCYEYEGGNETSKVVYGESRSMNLSGTAYRVSVNNTVTAIGCDDMVLGMDEVDGSYINGGCSALCLLNNDTRDLGYCPLNATSPSYACCQSPLYGDRKLVGAELVDLSGRVGRRKLFPCSYAFIQEEIENENVFSYPLHYLHNSTALQNENWVVRLDWIVGSENCIQAKLNPKTYACQDYKSVCDDADLGGYLCKCVQGYEGNPYLPGGCKPISLSLRIAKPGCLDQCGNLQIAYPFGVGPNCFLDPSFEIICNDTTNPPEAYLRIIPKTRIKELVMTNTLSRLYVYYPYRPGVVCYNFSEMYLRPRLRYRASKTDDRNLTIDLSATQYTLSEDNLIRGAGCDDMVVVTVRGGNKSTIGTGCAAICNDRWRTGGHEADFASNVVGACPSGTTKYTPGMGCCTAPVPRGTNYLEANLVDLSGEWAPLNFSCSYVFVHHGEYNHVSLNINSTSILSQREFVELALDWRIGAANCKEARKHLPNFACQANSDCVDFDANNVGGYLCHCSQGYQGNPYLALGCQDIDECADNTTNVCNSNSKCINTAGSFICSCPKGYYGDGRKDGKGCIRRLQIKFIILIGFSSGLGLLLLVLVCFWLFKVFQKREEKIKKEKFFKRNGGLLLQEETNKGALGNIKVFPANELEVATDHFNESRIIGQGGQGTVYKGMLSDGKIVAIKMSKLVEDNQVEEFINEVVIVSQINHRNVVKLLGCCLEMEVPLLVYEFMPNGTLSELIHDPSNEFPFPWSMRLKIATDIAGALAYLHSASSQPIFHRDIKSSNLLLDEKYVVKVSDFGTSRSIPADQTHLTTLVKGTFGYLDPEYFQSSQFTEKSDVYSFGVVLLELLTGQKPISSDRTEEERGLAARFLTCMDENCLDTILDPQILEQGSKEEVILVASLVQRCLNLKGRMRPTMKEVATELESFRISQMCSVAKDECEDERGFKDMPTIILENEFT